MDSNDGFLVLRAELSPKSGADCYMGQLIRGPYSIFSSRTLLPKRWKLEKTANLSPLTLERAHGNTT